MIQDHKEYFDKNGYVAFNNFIPDEDLAVISALAESIYASNLKKIGQTKESGSGEYNKKHIDIEARNHPQLYKYFTSTAMLRVAKLLLGENVFLFYDQFVIKEQDSAAGYFQWHTDNYYGAQFGIMNSALAGTYKSITCAWCLDDLTLDNGCVIISPTHSSQPADLATGNVRLNRSDRDIRNTSVVLTASRGDLLVWNGNTPHFSLPNHTRNKRRVWLNVYSNQAVDSAGKYYNERLDDKTATQIHTALGEFDSKCKEFEPGVPSSVPLIQHGSRRKLVKDLVRQSKLKIKNIISIRGNDL